MRTHTSPHVCALLHTCGKWRLEDNLQELFLFSMLGPGSSLSVRIFVHEAIYPVQAEVFILTSHERRTPSFYGEGNEQVKQGYECCFN